MLAEVESLDRSSADDDLHRVLDDVGVVERGGPGINSPDRVAEVILEAATADRPNSAYRVGPSATAGTYLGSAVRGRVRDRASNAGVGLLSSALAQRLLERPTTANAEGAPANTEKTTANTEGMPAATPIDWETRASERRPLSIARRGRRVRRDARWCAVRSAARR